jgi:protein mago nashi
MAETEDFFLRYYIGHKGAYGHEYLDFEVDASGKLKYLNHSKYKNDSLISK